jgi:hypothetical protein
MFNYLQYKKQIPKHFEFTQTLRNKRPTPATQMFSDSISLFFPLIFVLVIYVNKFTITFELKFVSDFDDILTPELLTLCNINYYESTLEVLE